VVQWYFTAVKYSLYTLMKAADQGLNFVIFAPTSVFERFDVDSYDYLNDSYETKGHRNKSKKKSKSRAKKSQNKQYQKF